MTLKPYLYYTSEESSALQALPRHWRFARLRSVAAMPLCNGIGEASDQDDPDNPRYVRITDIGGPRWLRDDTFRSLPTLIAAQASLAVGDILLAAVGATFGKSYLHVTDTGPACFAGYLVRFRPGKELSPEFASYWTESSSYWDQVRAGVIQSTVQNFSAARYRELYIPVPSLVEQSAIASFLDRETGKIDALVAEQERLIALLKEKRQAVISQAVTKGLDPNVPMKNSGVEWLGNVPAHWAVLTLNRVVQQFVDYRGATPNKISDGIPLLTTGSIKKGRIDHSLDEVFISEEEYAERMTRGFPSRGDLLLTTEAPLGEAALIEKERVAPGQRMILMKPDLKYMTGRYLLAHFLSQFGQGELQKRASGSTASGIRADRLRSSSILVPPSDEQGAICEHIDSQTATFDELEAGALVAIGLLRERRAALISAAVTGKIDVRDQSAAEQQAA